MNYLESVEHLDSRRLKFTVNGISQIFHPVHENKDVSELQEVLDIRHFLTSVGITRNGAIELEGKQLPCNQEDS